ncbi:MAG: hypothetical protein ACR2F6_02200 [Mycobacteriales bacterium]
MGHNDMVCAACSGRISEGRCAVCRSTRDQMRHTIDWQAVLVPLLVIAALVAGLMTYYVKFA